MIPAENNVMVASPLANLKSIGQMMGRDCAAAVDCGYCSYGLLMQLDTSSAMTVQIHECAHLVVSS